MSSHHDDAVRSQCVSFRAGELLYWLPSQLETPRNAEVPRTPNMVSLDPEIDCLRRTYQKPCPCKQHHWTSRPSGFLNQVGFGCYIQSMVHNITM